MRIKEVKPINFLYFRTETKVGGLKHLVPVAQELFREAVQQGVNIAGAVQWHYFDFTGDKHKLFTLEIALPVSDVPREYDGYFHFKRTELFKCVSVLHEGSWADMSKSYRKLMQFITEKKLVPSALNRELYINTDLHHPEANITEIQVGVRGEGV